MKITFLCKGTRGDARPLLALATQWRKSKPTWQVTLACTISVSSILAQDIDDDIEVVKLPDQPAQQMSNEELTKLLRAEVECCLAASQNASIIVFNLFTLEGWFIANHLSIPCVAASPFLLNRAPPDRFYERLQGAQPEIFASLKQALPGQVSMAEVDHWMWRLFLDDLGDTCTSVGLQNVPFLKGQDTVLLPSPTPLLYGISPSLLRQQAFWPDSVHVCGCWEVTSPDPQLVPCKELVTLVESMSSPLIFIGFGSMEALYCQVIDWKKTVTNINSALAACNAFALWQCYTDQVKQVFKDLSPGRICHWKGSFPHCWLFQHCVGVVHHGGIGTTTSALRAGLPAVMCPFQSEQHYWAEQLSWLGVGVQCPSLKTASINDYLRSFKTMLSTPLSDAAKQLQLKIKNEDGIKIALSVIEQQLKK